MSTYNINYLVIKGIAYSKLLYNDLISRGRSRDIDIFISIEDLEKVIEGLNKLGFVHYNNCNLNFKNNFLWNSFRNNFENSLVLVNKESPKSISIDIHWRLSSIKNKLQ